MQRLTKGNIKNAVVNTPPGIKLFNVFPGSLEPGIDVSLHVIFPPGLEDQVPKEHRNAIIVMREELRKELDQCLEDGCEKNFLRYCIISQPYLEKLNKLIGHDALLESYGKVPYVQQQREVLKHNCKMQKKVEEYQERKCGTCNKKGLWKGCGRCRKIYYCSEDCQRKDWSSHKVGCNV